MDVASRKKLCAVIQVDGENLCELYCVNSKVVSIILHSLKVNKAAELDKIAARLLRNAEEELAPSIICLINKSTQMDLSLPLVTRVRPLYKTEDNFLVEN